LNEPGKDVAFARAAGRVVLIKADNEVVLTEIEELVALYEEANVVVSAHVL
jgi:protein involved in temperature-dependent protein secretion